MRVILWLKELFKQIANTTDETFYQVKKGTNQTEWITLDELMKRNKEHHFYQNLLGERKHENFERRFRETNGKLETSKILSVSNLRARDREKEHRRHGLS